MSKLDQAAIIASEPMTVKEARGSGRRWPRTLFFAGAVGLQMILLGGMAAQKLHTLNAGTVVTLKAQTYDPHDVFRGEYIRLRYDASCAPAAFDAPRGKQVYVVLTRGEPYWTAKAVYDHLPQVGDGEVAVKARANYRAADGKLTVNYDFEQYFVKEGVARPIEKENPPLTVQVAVDRDGNAAIKQLFVKDKAI